VGNELRRCSMLLVVHICIEHHLFHLRSSEERASGLPRSNFAHNSTVLFRLTRVSYAIDSILVQSTPTLLM
jgi:hypothetical protein